MWLMNTLTGKLAYFIAERAPTYAILSHVWGTDEQTFHQCVTEQSAASDPSQNESSAQPLVRTEPLPSNLHPKVRRCCEYAAGLGFRWVWMDMCCIDATLCIAYLADVPDDADPAAEDGPLRKSRWFERGWTLQELIAPSVVLLVSEGWKPIGTKAMLANTLESITGIDAAVLTFSRAVSTISISERMRWASKRETTRIEDRAYSLQGLFAVNLPTLYGEGEAAFQRLQEEIMKVSPDQTLFCWELAGPLRSGSRGLLAPSTREFDACDTCPLPEQEIPTIVETMRAAITGTPTTEDLMDAQTPAFSMTSHGVHARLPLLVSRSKPSCAIAVLAVRSPSQQRDYVGLRLSRMASTLPHYHVGGDRHRDHRTIVLPRDAKEASSFLDVTGPGDVTVGWESFYIKEERPPPLLPTHEDLNYPFWPIWGPDDWSLPDWVLSNLARQGFELARVEAGVAPDSDANNGGPTDLHPRWSESFLKLIEYIDATPESCYDNEGGRPEVYCESDGGRPESYQRDDGRPETDGDSYGGRPESENESYGEWPDWDGDGERTPSDYESDGLGEEHYSQFVKTRMFVFESRVRDSSMETFSILFRKGSYSLADVTFNAEHEAFGPPRDEFLPGPRKYGAGERCVTLMATPLLSASLGMRHRGTLDYTLEIGLSGAVYEDHARRHAQHAVSREPEAAQELAEATMSGATGSGADDSAGGQGREDAHEFPSDSIRAELASMRTRIAEAEARAAAADKRLLEAESLIEELRVRASGGTGHYRGRFVTRESSLRVERV